MGLCQRPDPLAHDIPVDCGREVAPADANAGVGLIITHAHRLEHVAGRVTAGRTR